MELENIQEQEWITVSWGIWRMLNEDAGNIWLCIIYHKL